MATPRKRRPWEDNHKVGPVENENRLYGYRVGKFFVPYTDFTRDTLHLHLSMGLITTKGPLHQLKLMESLMDTCNSSPNQEDHINKYRLQVTTLMSGTKGKVVLKRLYGWQRASGADGGERDSQ